MSAAPRSFSRYRITALLFVAVGAGLGCTDPNLPDSGPLGPGPGPDETLDPLPPTDPFEPPPAEVGRIKAKTVTSGVPIGGTAWVVSVQGGPSAPIGINSTVVVNDVVSGERIMSLEGVAANCTLTKGENPRRLTVTAGLAAQTEFNLACTNPGRRTAGD